MQKINLKLRIIICLIVTNNNHNNGKPLGISIKKVSEWVG